MLCSCEKLLKTWVGCSDSDSVPILGAGFTWFRGKAIFICCQITVAEDHFVDFFSPMLIPSSIWTVNKLPSKDFNLVTLEYQFGRGKQDSPNLVNWIISYGTQASSS